MQSSIHFNEFYSLILVDVHVPIKDVKVLVHEGVTYAATLNQVSILSDVNKFYILQALESQTKQQQFYLFLRWGRVGMVGQHCIMGPWTRDVCINEYNKKMDQKKTNNYTIVQINYGAGALITQAAEVKSIEQQNIPSTLDPKVQDLVKLIFDIKMINYQMREIGYDIMKMPLGKLSKSSIMKGYEALNILMQQVKGEKRKQVINEQSSMFYCHIPHDFGFKLMSSFVLDSEIKIRQKLEMLESLESIQVFTELSGKGKTKSELNEIDYNYLKLQTQIQPLDKNTEQFKIIERYVNNTHGATHTAFKLEIQDVFTLRKEAEEQRFRKDIDNKQLLWHGSRLSNYVSTLSQGFKFPPPETPVQGYYFGKGIYFTDMVSKSANHCFANKQNDTGLLLLCQVALGECNQKYHADYNASLLPHNKHSVKGCGKSAPQEGEKMGDVFVPNGVAKETHIQNSALLYNDFVVYDLAQIKSRYLLRLKFIYA